MTDRLTVATRRSPLARAQTDLVVRALARRNRRLRFEIRPIETSGDRDLRAGASPDFTDAIDRAVRAGEVDLAVHSAKDLPLAPVPGLTLASCPPRADPRDCLVFRSRSPARSLPRAARVGSSSLRRRAQLLRWRPDLKVVEIRGNVDSRLRRVRDGRVDAVVLAAAGLRRLGRDGEIGRLLSTRDFLPAPAQGALALVVRTDDRRAGRLAKSVDHLPTHAAVLAERSFAAALGGDCNLPLAALARVRGATLLLEGEVLTPDGRVRFRAKTEGPARRAADVGARLGASLLDRGAAALLRSARP